MEQYNSPSPHMVGGPSNCSFTTAYASATTILLSNLPTAVSAFVDSNIIAIDQINASGALVRRYNKKNDIITLSANTITVSATTIPGGAFATTDKFVVYTNVPATVTINTGDIEIGAVEIKNGTSDTRLTVLVDDTPFTPATDTGMVMFAQADETSTDSVDEGDAGAVRMSLRRAMKVDLDTAIAGEDLTNNVIAIAQKPLSANTYTPSRDSSTALEASSISKASAGNLYHAFGVVDKSAPTGLYYIQFLNSATLTGDGAVTHLITPIPVNHVTGTDSTFEAGPFPFGVAASSGIVIVLSTTMVTKTISGSYLFATVLYV